ncbi:Hypp3659 [Branchiostoma lanceolatum]|uniref:Hypp3659 protein n=1 Tax=Branchiostoma lanceolatum TaxID=7740 RepID=A0A8K0A3U4_BRALA|nr:Hypp3659 [Branchiostoma lanceolatum]
MENLQHEAEKPPSSPTTEAWVGPGSKDGHGSVKHFMARPAVALVLLYLALVTQTMLTSGAPAAVGPVLERR